jgi:hypothetical protein
MSRVPRLALTAVLLLVAGCHKQYSPLSPSVLEPSVLRLTRALHAELGHVANDELVSATFQKKPELARDFQGYTIRAQSSGTNLVVLVCTEDGKYALLEDASWTPYVDRKWYETEPRHPATFTIDPATGPPSPRQ